MELDNYFQVMFTDGSEKFIANKAETTPAVIKQMEDGVLASEFIALQQIDNQTKREPVYFRKTSILSVKKVGVGVIGQTNKVWRIL